MEIQPNDLQQQQQEHSQQSQPQSLSAFLSSRARNPRFAQRKSVQRGLSSEGLQLPVQAPEYDQTHIKPSQDHGKLHLGRSQIHWKELIEKDKRIQDEQSRIAQEPQSQRASTQRKQLNLNGGIQQSSIRLFLSAARNHGTSSTAEESQKLKYEEMHVEQKLKQLLLSKHPPISSNNSMSQTPHGTIEGDDADNIIKDSPYDKQRQLSLPPGFEGSTNNLPKQPFQLGQDLHLLPQTSRRSISPRLVSLDSFSRYYQGHQVETIQPMTQRSYAKYSLVNNNNCLESPQNMQQYQQQNKSVSSKPAGRHRKVSEDNKSYADSKRDTPIVTLMPNSSQSAAVSPKNSRRQDISQSASSSSAETLYQQYINRLISARNKQRDTQLAAAVLNAATAGSHSQDNSNNTSMKHPQKQLDSSAKGTLSALPFLEDSYSHSQSATLSGHNIIYSSTPRVSQRNIYSTSRLVGGATTSNKDSSSSSHLIPLLNYPASSKDLQAFSKAQEANELRFALMAAGGGDEELQQQSQSQELSGISKLKNKKTLLFSSHSKSLANFSRSKNAHKADSLRISELVKERNEALEIQKAEKMRNQAEQGLMLNAQVEGLIEENNSQSNRIIDAGSSHKMIKRNKRNLSYQPLVIEINDPSEIQKGIKLISTNNSSNKHGNNNSNNSMMMMISKDKRSTSSHIIQLQETTNNNNNQYNQSQDLSEATFQVQLAQQATLVNHLQQQKIGIRELLKVYLLNSQKTSKAILKNCLMDAEQFVFFMTSFYQFCIDDMFYQYKKSATQELAHKTSNNQQHRTMHTFPSMGQLSTEESSSMPTFKFNQKIPSDIVMPIIDIIGDYLKGIPLVAIRDASPRRTLKSPIKIQRGDSPVLKKISEENDESSSPTNKRKQLRLVQIQSNNISESHRSSLLRFAQPLSVTESIEQTTSEYLSTVVPPPVELQPDIDRFIDLLQSRSYQCLIPVSMMERIGGFAKIRELIIEGVKMINNYINSASKMNLIEENDEQLIDKHLMPAVCALINKDTNTLMTQLTLFQQQNALSYYDFFTIKKVFWDLMSNARLDAGIKSHVILQLENLRFCVFKHPFEGRINDLAVALGKQYEICNYFRGNTNNNSSSNSNSNSNHNSATTENASFLRTVFYVMYNNQPYSTLQDVLAPRLKFPVNDKFFDHLARFLLEELTETDQKSILDLTIRLQKLKLKANVTTDIFSLFNDDADAFFGQFQPFLKHWISKYNLGNSLMDAKAMDFKFLEIFVKWALTKQDMFSVGDTEPALMHFVVNEFTISLWVKGIAAFFESRQTDKSLYQPLVQFVEMYLLFKRNDALVEGGNRRNINKQPISPKKMKQNKSSGKINEKASEINQK